MRDDWDIVIRTSDTRCKAFHEQRTLRCVTSEYRHQASTIIGTIYYDKLVAVPKVAL
jgi:hypothetical protein